MRNSKMDLFCFCILVKQHKWKKFPPIEIHCKTTAIPSGQRPLLLYLALCPQHLAPWEESLTTDTFYNYILKAWFTSTFTPNKSKAKTLVT